MRVMFDTNILVLILERLFLSLLLNLTVNDVGRKIISNL